ncbi:MAG: hypothetical protein AAFU71_06095 [Cyanobacteria bacterium J06632_22]
MAVAINEIQPVLSRRSHITQKQQNSLIQALQACLMISPIRPTLSHWFKTTWQPSSRLTSQILVDHITGQIADYLKDQPTFEPRQLSADIAQLIKQTVRSHLPLLSLTARPNLSLPHTQTWKDALETRRDLTVIEIQNILEHTQTPGTKPVAGYSAHGKTLATNSAKRPNSLWQWCALKL